VAAAIAASPEQQRISTDVQAELTKSFSSAADTAQQYPQYSTQIIAGARSAFLDGANWAYAAGVVAVAVGAVLVWFLFPRKEQEQQLLAGYQAQDQPMAERDGVR
jgi:hypothetical protein